MEVDSVSQSESPIHTTKRAKYSDSPKSAAVTGKPAPGELRGEDTSNTPSDDIAAAGAPNSRKKLILSPCNDIPVSSGAPPSTDWFINFFKDFEARSYSRLEDMLDRKLEVLTAKISHQEEKIASLEFDLHGVQDEMMKLKKENDNLLDKLDDLENRSRRCNVVIFGIPEQAHGERENCTKTVTDFLQFCSGHDLGQEFANSIERCHRTPTHVDSKAPPQKPRVIHVAFLSYAVKEKVRKAVIDKLKRVNQYRGNRVFIGEDFSRRVQQHRKDKMPKLQQLKREGKKPFFSYPAKLRYRDEATGKIVNVE